jgi:hypothetical protein
MDGGGPFEVLYFVEPPRMFWHVACCIFVWLIQAVARHVGKQESRKCGVAQHQHQDATGQAEVGRKWSTPTR